MNHEKPFSVDEFLEKLAANDPEVALDPEVQAGLNKLAQVVEQPPVLPRLLLVDDNDGDVRFFESALARTNVALELVRVRNGQGALDYFEGKGPYEDRTRFPLPHLTILDLKMPGMDGLTVLRRIRALPCGAQSVVIVLTGSDNEADINEVRSLNISAYLIKPSTYTALVELVRQLKATWIDHIILPRNPEQ